MKGICVVPHKREVIFSMEIVIKTHELPRLKPTIILPPSSIDSDNS